MELRDGSEILISRVAFHAYRSQNFTELMRTLYRKAGEWYPRNE